MGYRMQDEASVDRVLRALGSVEATAGLEGRVLVRLAEARAAQGARTPWRRAAAAYVCLALCVAGGWMALSLERGRMERPVRTAGVGSTFDAGQPRVADDVARVEMGSGVPSAPGRMARRRPVPRTVADGAAGAVGRGGDGGPSGGTSADEVALNEMNLPSRVAPPEPLTAQERLLLRAAKTRGVSALVEGAPEADAALREAQAKRQAEPHTLFAEFGRGLFAGIGSTADE